MSSNLSSLISELQKSTLFAECPHCRQEFQLKNQTIFDGRKKFPSDAEIVKQEWLHDIENKKQELEKRQIKADVGAEKKAIEVSIGKIIEKVIPAYKNFNLPISDCRFLSEPIDMVVFNGASDMKVSNITFMDIKTGNSKLNTHQRQIRDAVIDNEVKFKVM